MAKIRTALIIGGGIAGPVAAMALRKTGIEATVYEAYPPTAEGLGGSLGLASNGVAALEIVGAADAVRALATPTPNMLMTIRGKKVMEGSAFPQDQEPLQLIARAQLQQVLHDAAQDAGVPFAHSKRLVTADEHEDGITARFADHTSAFAAYEQLRRERVEKITASGRKINHAKTPGPVAGLLMRAFMPLMFKKAIEKTSGPSLRFRIDFDAPVPGEICQSALAAR